MTLKNAGQGPVYIREHSCNLRFSLYPDSTQSEQPLWEYREPPGRGCTFEIPPYTKVDPGVVRTYHISIDNFDGNALPIGSSFLSVSLWGWRSPIIAAAGWVVYDGTSIKVGEEAY